MIYAIVDLFKKRGIDAMYEVTPNQAKRDFYKIIKMVNEKSMPIEVKGKTEDESVVIMSAKYYKAIQEKLHSVDAEIQAKK